jgi:hypothetical protein
MHRRAGHPLSSAGVVALILPATADQAAQAVIRSYLHQPETRRSVGDVRRPHKSPRARLQCAFPCAPSPESPTSTTGTIPFGARLGDLRLEDILIPPYRESPIP